MKYRLIQTLIIIAIAACVSAQTRSFKRGFCGNLESAADIEASVHLSWFYNWYHSPEESVKDILADRIDFVPMAWGSYYNRDALKAYLTEHSETEYLLGFNEPNFIHQANIGPKAAAALWPELQEIADDFNLKLVGPAMNFSYSGGAVTEEGVEYTDPIQYLDSFFIALPPDSRVDYVAIHGYFDYASAFPWYVGLYEKYNRPVWITEFNHSASWVSEVSQQNFMVEALNYMEQEPKVFRYAWFLARSSQSNTNLFQAGTDGVLTDLGQIFSNMSTYDSSFYHKPDSIIEAEHYINMSGIHLTATQDTGGILAAHDFDAGDWMDYNVNVSEAGTYSAQFRIASDRETSFSLYVDNKFIERIDIPSTGGLEEWQTITYDVDLNSGKQIVRIRPNGGGWKLNWWRLEESVSSVHLPAKESAIEIFPNPVYDRILNITGAGNNSFVTITDMRGESRARYQLSGDAVIDLSYFSAGFYILQVITDDKIVNQILLIP